jgi:hypothetical protein
VLRDPRDDALPAAGWVELEDLETGKRRLVNTSSRRTRELYQKRARERLQHAQMALKRARVPMVEVLTDRSYMPILMRYFAARRRGRGTA